jgi:LPS sulfotransferase NodH
MILKQCRKHRNFPDLESCIICITNYENILRRWFGEKAVENFRLHYQREIIPMALMILKRNQSGR